MKKILLITLTFAYSCFGYSQTTVPTNDQKSLYGFNIGVNYSNAYSKQDLPANTSIHNGIGFNMGIVANYKLSRIFSFSPKAEISFFNSRLTRKLNDGTETSNTIMPSVLDLKAHLTVKKPGKTASPYLLIGPSVKIPVGNKPQISTQFVTGTDVAIDFGIGFSKTFSRYGFAPELRYSYGLLNVNGNPVLKSLYFNNVSLVLNILG